MSSAFKRLLPTFNRVLIQKFEPQTKTKSGIILTQTADTNIVGKVVATGPGNMTTEGKIIPVSVKVGDTVLLPDFGGQKVQVNSEELFIFRDSEVIGVLEN
ncbi:GroES (chaperonin 10)-like protein [Pseudocohnilembus persalinus]|uniref:GroES (Chaperonin 10)-like protein n=1 Tax=Pseudocohnilembus persalinus TaxID=266149 RepID=A0A0V0QWQ0_PSEPJ|nr:GroES (chaperonin 10)-like protein [Pseudocohnilembus persalinus]|eukprot:KRX06796.1 GroES (chaperonin 10)-like protein [Pseudocohnilembus persalinus]